MLSSYNLVNEVAYLVMQYFAIKDLYDKNLLYIHLNKNDPYRVKIPLIS